MITTCEADPNDFDIERHLLTFLQKSTFFAEISRQLTKICTVDKKMPTAAVGYDPISEAITLYYNPNFFKTLTHDQVMGVIRHEFYHLIFNHITFRRKTPPKLWNVATDLAINSIIIDDATHREKRPAGFNPLPDCVLVPGRWPKAAGGRDMSPDEKAGSEVAQAIAGFKPLQSSEFYFMELMKAAQKDAARRGGGAPGDPDGEFEFDSFDEHDMWDDVPEQKRQQVEGKVRQVIESAVRKADQMADGWGDVPAEMRELIRKSITTVVDWRSVLRQFIGQLVRGGRTSTIKRINRKYPYIHPGKKRSYVAKLLIARDESGSVYDQMLEEFFGELNAITRKVEIDFVPFDCYCTDKDIVRWAKGTVPEKATKRTKGGGTDFSAPTRIFNDPKNRGRWDGILIMTDGEAGEPEPARGKRGWVLGQGCKLLFPSQELQVFLTKDKPMVGAWR